MPGTNSSNLRRFKVFSTKKISMQVEEAENQTRKYWLVESDTKSLLTIRPLDDQTWLPTGRSRPITVRELQKRYTPEPGIYEEHIQPILDQHAGDHTLLDAPAEEAPPVNESAVISDFEKGLNLLKAGNAEKAATLFSGMLRPDEPFEEKHKHLFNDFAIQLRKNNQSGQAIAFYTRALELSWGDEDENLHINLARALLTEKQYGGCVQHLFEALRIAPGHTVARNFLTWLDEQKLVPKQYALQVKGCLTQQSAPEAVPARTEGSVALHVEHDAPVPGPARAPEHDATPGKKTAAMADDLHKPSR